MDILVRSAEDIFGGYSVGRSPGFAASAFVLQAVAD